MAIRVEPSARGDSRLLGGPGCRWSGLLHCAESAAATATSRNAPRALTGEPQAVSGKSAKVLGLGRAFD